MNRRRFLAAIGTASASGMAGCGGLTSGADGTDGTGDQTTKTSYGNAPPVVEDRPDEPYVPTHVEGMSMVGTQTDGDYACALTFTFPHRFWLVTGTRTRKVVITKADTVHLMPVIWHTDAQLVPPDISLQVTITRGDETVADFAPWPMLSQPMGFHFGDNVELPGDDTYTVTVEAGTPSDRRTGGFTPNDSLHFEFEWDFRQVEVDVIDYRDIPGQREGMPGAVPPMDMMTVPMTQAPAPDTLPGRHTALGVANGAEFYATIVDDATPYGGTSDQAYLAVSPRTKYNGFVLPMMSLSATATADGDTLHDGPLSGALDPDLGYHYGTTIPTTTATVDLTVRVDASPQVSRHEGYETAFLDIPDQTGTI